MVDCYGSIQDNVQYSETLIIGIPIIQHLQSDHPGLDGVSGTLINGNPSDYSAPTYNSTSIL